jgi:hypothetical protein
MTILQSSDSRITSLINIHRYDGTAATIDTTALTP